MPHIQVARLSEHHLASVVALEREIYPPDTQEEESLIAARLRFEDDHHSSLNLGLFEDDRLVGYILAHVDDGSEFPEHPIGDNVYVADIAVRPLYRRQLIRLLQAFTREVRIEYPGLPVVAHSIGGTSELWERHAAIIQRLGGRMATRIDGVATRSGQTASLIVWQHLTGEEAPSRAAADSAKAPAETVALRSGRRLGVRAIENEEGLIALGDAWRKIERALPGLTVFQTHRYQCAWARNFAISRRILVLAIYDGDEIAGIAPFQVSVVQMHGREQRQLSFLGAPWEVDRPTFLFPRLTTECAEAAALALLARRGQWDIAWFHEQVAGDPALEAFCATLAAAGVLHGRTASSRCPYLRFEGTWKELLGSKSQKFRKNLKAARRKLEAEGELAYESVNGDAGRLQSLILEYGELEQRSWKAKAGIGASQSVEHLRFYLQLAAEFGDTGDFRFRCLRVGGRLVAATFGIAHRRRYYSLHIVNDGAFAKHSAGTYLEALELEECFGLGLDEYDFLGGFLTNKSRWATQMRETVAVHLYQRKPFLVAVFIAYFKVKAPLKRLLNRLGVTWASKDPENRLKAQA
jgi:CelD/BcsL family acetyltransferase involved in cellulose biosynthesis